MRYYSTSNQSPLTSFREATIRGLAPDKGLYFPEEVPMLPPGLISGIAEMPEAEIAYRVMAPYVGSEIPEAELRRIVEETISFPVPLVPVHDGIFSLELYHGPTLAFKDTGARFMSRCLGYFMRGSRQQVTVLVATSGDTGGAVASGFYQVEGVEVVILYPSGKVSSVQEKQLTSLGGNIHALEVNGTFDDCQQMVKEMFADADLNRQVFLTSANSINIARWLPQQFYYFLAYRQWVQRFGAAAEPPVIAVPSGNFGNICAGILAHVSGLPVKHFIAACNANDVVPQFLQDGEYRPKKAVATLSNAMDVGNPSNFIRILELFDHRIIDLKKVLSSSSVSDDTTRQTLREVYRQHGYLLDPHGAVGYRVLEDYLAAHPGQQGIVLETAHPVKFYDVVEPVTGEKVPLPPAVQAQLLAEKHSIRMEPDSALLRDFLLSRA